MSKNSSNSSLKHYKLVNLIKHLIGVCLYKGKRLDENLFSCPISITRVLLSPDRSLIRCYFIAFNTNLTSQELLESLNKSRNYIRYFLAQKLAFKYSPKINFYYDDGFFNLEDVELALKKDKQNI